MTIKQTLFSSVIALGVVLSLFFANNIASAATDFVASQTKTTAYERFTFFSGGGSGQTATTTTATSTNVTGGGGYFVIAGARTVELLFGRGDTTGQGNTGSSIFNIQVTPDGTNWYDYADLRITSSATSTSNINRAQRITIPAGTSTVIARMESLGFYGIRCIVVETTDGEHSCQATADF